MENRARMMPVFGGVIFCSSVLRETVWSLRRHFLEWTEDAVDRRLGCRRRTPAGSVCPGVGGGGGRLASWASLAFSHHGSGSLCPHASLLPGESHYHPLLPYINTLGLQTNPHCSEISRGGRTVPLSEAERGREDGWEGGREAGGGGRGSGVALQIPTKDNET